MEELRIKYGVKIINCKYNNCKDYSRIIIPPTVKKIIGSFNNINNLEEIIFESEIDNQGNTKTIEIIDDSFNNSNSLNNIIFQTQDITIINNSFNKSKTLKKVY